MFGYACGIGGSPQPYLLKTIRLVNNYDSITLRKYAASNNSQEKIHGLVGLYFLKENGVKLSDEDKTSIKMAQKSDEIIILCEGCFFGRQQKLKELITQKMLRRYYDWYTKTGWTTYK